MKIKDPKTSELDFVGLQALVEPLRRMEGSKTADMVAEMSDAMLEVFLRTTRENDRERAIKKMWDLEEWLTRKL
ncbi:MAG: hypothetical protein AB1476_03460 [Candidatus Hadarchaeota archaeon]